MTVAIPGLDAAQQNALARAIQADFPLEVDPFARLARDLGVTPAQVIDQLVSWKEEGKLREISAVLEGEALGYDSALVAGSVPGERLEQVAAIVSAHPTVTHNYQREHAYNLWFTIATPPEMSLERTLELLAAEAGVERFLPLRRTETFKIGVNFDLDQKQSLTEAGALSAPAAWRPGEEERRWLRVLQVPLELVERPFDRQALLAGTSPGQLLAFARRLKSNGVLRRYVATFRHRRLGVRGNGMGVWRVPSGRTTEVGRRLASAPEVSHCYARETIPGFPYSVYSMIHGPDRASVEQVAARLADEVGVEDSLVLFSTREFKKTRLRYYLPELDAWWRARAEGGTR